MQGVANSADEAADGVHHGSPSQASQHVGQVFAVLDLDHEQHRRRAQIPLLVFDGVDIRLRLRDRSSNRCKDTWLVVDDHLQGHLEIATDVPVPGNLDEALGALAELGDIRAFELVHDDALAGRQIADNVVARQGMAAVPERDDAALCARDQDGVIAADSSDRIERCEVTYQRKRHRLCDAIAERDLGEQFLKTAQAVLGEIGVECGRGDLLDRRAK